VSSVSVVSALPSFSDEDATPSSSIPSSAGLVALSPPAVSVSLTFPDLSPPAVDSDSFFACCRPHNFGILNNDFLSFSLLLATPFSFPMLVALLLERPDAANVPLAVTVDASGIILA
jgi:hypothetical protein